LVKVKGKYGYIDLKGKMHIAAKWEEASNFRKEGAVVKKDGKYGLLNHAGKMVFETEFDKIHIQDDALIVMEKDGKKSIYQSSQAKFIFKER
jgi:hypothetical protein